MIEHHFMSHKKKKKKKNSKGEEMTWSSSGLQRPSLFMLLLVLITGVEIQSKHFNVDSFDAIGDGKTKSSQIILCNIL